MIDELQIELLEEEDLNNLVEVLIDDEESQEDNSSS